jgi:drug/metabolite transporter (DMT)-like permease
VLRKLLAGALPPLAVVFWVALGQLPVVWLWDAAGGGGPITGRYLLVASGTVGLNILANAAFVAALARSPLSLTVPLLSLIPAMTAAFAWPVLGERPAPLQIAGIALVVAGAVLLGGAGSETGSLGGWWRALRREPGTPLMLTTAVCWSLALPLDKMGVGLVGPARHGTWLVGGVVVGTLVLLLLVHGRRGLGGLTWKMAPVLAASIAAGGIALVLQLLVIQIVLVGVVEAVKRAIGNFAALFVGAAFFREGMGWTKTIALVAMAAGVVLILLT